MVKKVFKLYAQVSSDSLSSVFPVAKEFIGASGTVKIVGGVIEIKATVEGESAKDLNRSLLSVLRRVEKKTRLRAQWTNDEVMEKFFDYVSKGVKGID